MKKLLLGLVCGTALLGAITFEGETADAHGYVETPPARGYQGSLDKNTMGWTSALEMYGNVITNPQSLEAPKGYPEKGPADGRIASAEGGLGQIGDFVLDSTGVNRWKKTDINTGVNTFTWKYTAAHSTTKWHYYMTKPGWNPEEPLARKNLELIGVVNHDKSPASTNLTHTIKVPENRLGYQVILAVWDVDDTPNAFYNVIDVNVKYSGTTPPIEVAPVKPTDVKATDVTTNSVKLTWTKESNVKEYNVYRDNKKVGTVGGDQFNDSNLKEKTTYSYQIEAVGFNGKISEKSDLVQITTKSSEVEDNQKPTVPTSLHSMGTTENSVDLMWAPSTHFLGVKNYEVYRDGQKIATTDKTRFKDTGLKANTTYKYTVKAVSIGGNVSDASAIFTVKTKSSEVEDNQKPTVPTSLHSMGTTENSVDLMWAPSTHFLGVKNYEVYRDGQKIATTDKTRFKDTGLKANTTYKYTVKAVSIGGNVSDASTVFTVKTKAIEEIPGDVKIWKAGTFSKPILYTAGEKVMHKNKVYQVLNTHFNYGDTTWAPSEAASLFKLIK